MTLPLLIGVSMVKGLTESIMNKIYKMIPIVFGLCLIGYGINILLKGRLVIPKYGYVVELGDMSTLVGVIMLIIGGLFIYAALNKIQ